MFRKIGCSHELNEIKASKRSCSFKKTTECRCADAVPFKATILQNEKTLCEENWIVPRASSRRQK